MRKPWVYKRKNVKGWWVGWCESGKRKAAAVPRVKFHDLRKTFASLPAQRGVPTAVTQRLLEHSSPQLTNDVYINVDPVLRQAVNQLPVSDWVSGESSRIGSVKAIAIGLSKRGASMRAFQAVDPIVMQPQCGLLACLS